MLPYSPGRQTRIPVQLILCQQDETDDCKNHAANCAYTFHVVAFPRGDIYVWTSTMLLI
jgi:hypothetical protein